jgi:hypothetical protein
VEGNIYSFSYFMLAIYPSCMKLRIEIILCFLKIPKQDPIDPWLSLLESLDTFPPGVTQLNPMLTQLFHFICFIYVFRLASEYFACVKSKT